MSSHCNIIWIDDNPSRATTARDLGAEFLNMEGKDVAPFFATLLTNSPPDLVIVDHILDKTANFETDRMVFTPETAQALMAIEFGQEDKDRMSALVAKAQAGTLSAEEQDEIETYSRVGSLISILKSKARTSMKGRRSATRKPR